MLAVFVVLSSCEPVHVDHIPHEINYTLDGGYWTDEAPRTKAIYNNRIILPECEKLGYTLTGWKSDQVKVDGTTETGFSFVMPAAEVTLTPIWGANINLINYDLSNGSWPISYLPKTKAHTNETIIISKDPELIGSEFVSWQSHEVDISLTKDGWTFVMPPEKVSLKAIFSEKAFLISYILGEGAVWDGSYYIDYASYGQNVEIVAEPVRKGYTFKGWISDDVALSHNKIWSFTMPGKDVDIEAKWSTNRNSITYTGTEGSDFDKSQYPDSALTGEVITLPNLTKADRNFRGWKITGAEVFHADGRIQFKMSGEDVIAEALWIGDEYSITYSGVEGTHEAATLPTKGYAGDIITLPKLEYGNHVFTGWEGNIPTGIELGKDEGTYTFEMPLFNVKLTANWEVKINFAGKENAAADDILPESVKKGSSTTLPSLSKKGAKFLGWFINDVELEKSGKGWVLKQTDDEPQTITAKWKNVYDVVYFCYGQRMTTDSVVEGESYTIRENLKPALENFAGWVDDKYTLYTKDQVITGSKNLTLNAVYATPINGRIFYDDFDPNINKNQYLFFKNDFTKIDYTFTHYPADCDNCYQSLEEAVYYWTSSNERTKDRFYAFDTRRHDINYDRWANTLYWVPQHLSDKDLKEYRNTRSGINATGGSIMGTGKYNTEMIFGIINVNDPIFYTDYIVGTSRYATEEHDSDKTSVWFYVNFMNKNRDYSTDWYVGSYGEYKKLSEVLIKYNSPYFQYLFRDRDSHVNIRKVFTSSEAGPDANGNILITIFDGAANKFVTVTKQTAGQVIPLRSF